MQPIDVLRKWEELLRVNEGENSAFFRMKLCPGLQRSPARRRPTGVDLQREGRGARTGAAETGHEITMILGRIDLKS